MAGHSNNMHRFCPNWEFWHAFFVMRYMGNFLAWTEFICHVDCGMGEGDWGCGSNRISIRTSQHMNFDVIVIIILFSQFLIWLAYRRSIIAGGDITIVMAINHSYNLTKSRLFRSTLCIAYDVVVNIPVHNNAPNIYPV